MNFIYPKLRRNELPLMIALAAAGALVGGLYGALHDQITYSISEEYFTRVKFEQFHYADFGLSPRVLAAEIGFLASGGLDSLGSGSLRAWRFRVIRRGWQRVTRSKAGSFY